MVASADVVRTFRYFSDQCVFLNEIYTTLKGLYGEEQSDLRHRTAPVFFYNMWMVLHHALVLHICKLNDPAESRGQANLTVKQINKQLTAEGLLTQSITDVSNRLDGFHQKVSSLATSSSRTWTLRRSRLTSRFLQ